MTDSGSAPDGGAPVPAAALPGLARFDQLELDDLLDELRQRAVAVRVVQERMAELLEAVVAVSSDLELSEVLSHITRSACSLVGARYGALGVLGPDGEVLVEFITHGVTAQEREQIGPPPHGRGILGLLIRDPRTRRIRDIGSHVESFGFPANHPPMSSFLGTPISIRDEVFGNLYLAEKVDADEFTEADESVLEALASAAGIAIENARLYDASQRRARWSDAARRFVNALLSEEDEDEAWTVLSEHVLRLAGASAVGVALYDDAGRLVLRRAREEGAIHDVDPDPRVLDDPVWASVRAASQAVRLAKPVGRSVPTTLMTAMAFALRSDPRGAGALVPLSSTVTQVGFLLVTWDPAAPEGEHQAAELSFPELDDFAQQAGLAIVAARARRDHARMALLDDRERIARDMHDHVIQRLFAAGLTLQGASERVVDSTAKERLETVLDELDTAIREIRLSIFELHGAARESLSEHLSHMARVFVPALGFTPGVSWSPGIDDLPLAVRDDVVAVVREAFSNAARHARAGAVDALVRVDADGVTVSVSDDGVGIDEGQARSGLVNLANRAADRGGSCFVSRREPRGTTIEWRVPLAPGRRTKVPAPATE